MERKVRKLHGKKGRKERKERKRLFQKVGNNGTIIIANLG
jgi:hypothetical protein